MIDRAGIIFTYHVTKPVQYFLDNVSDFIWYSKVSLSIVHFDVRNSHYSPVAIIPKYILFSSFKLQAS